jgi:DNA-binding NarL/FixJ family response regulator
MDPKPEAEWGKPNSETPVGEELYLTDIEVNASVKADLAEIQFADMNVKAPVKTEAMAQAPAKPLTPRQLDILKLLARGYTNPQIAQKLVLSTGTVRTHVQRILAKLGAHDRTAAVVRAIELGLIAPPPSS